LSAAVESARVGGTLLDWEVARVNDSDEVVKVGLPPTGIRTDLLLEINGFFNQFESCLNRFRISFR
jgi:hypothetical protein